MQKRLKRAIFSDVKTHEEKIEPATPIEKLTELRALMPQAGYIRQAGLLLIIPVSPATLWRWVKKKNFPQPQKLSPRVTAWRIEDVLRWLRNGG